MRRSYRVVALLLVLMLVAGAVGAYVVLRSTDDLGSGSPAPEPSAAFGREGWHLVWSDEFDGDAVDPANWVTEDGSTYGDGGGQIACLMDRPRNVTVADGVLSLVARREKSPLACGNGADERFPEGRSYSSAHLSTRGLHDWTYARFEVRAKLPVEAGVSQGMWPAFWARPVEGGTGEIDVLEAVGESGVAQVHQTIWYDYTGTHEKEGSAYTFPAGVDPSDGMHTYTTDWSRDRITWYIDGVPVYERTAATTGWLAGTFDKPFYLRLNLAVGGDWPGDPTASTRFPSSYDIDYVRVYQRN